ncbi:MAG: hypothetical protein KatS3mg076_2874 [Candidatus Binatia bacterium]|nr:MAG: hypothetical protein KatS3mg076_2874 [Candidatus Binatia bacterium]
MATVITSECINCGACEPECPNTAIYPGGVEWELDGVKHPPLATDIFYIVPDKCTECVGFYDHEACAAVCPVDCCVPDPERPETEDVLIERAKRLHPDKEFPPDFPSRFRKAGAPAPETKGQPATPPEQAPQRAPEPPAPTAAPAPAAAPAAESTLRLPSLEEWEVPVECFRCGGVYAVAFRHFRAGVVFYCPFCNGSLVVTLPMHQRVAEALEEFHREWTADFEAFEEKRRRELAEFEERQRRRLEGFQERLRQVSKEARPPGAPRRRSWLFG